MDKREQMLIESPGVTAERPVQVRAGGLGERLDEDVQAPPREGPAELGQLVLRPRAEREVGLDGFAVLAEETVEGPDFPRSW